MTCVCVHAYVHVTRVCACIYAMYVCVHACDVCVHAYMRCVCVCACIHVTCVSVAVLEYI